MHNGKKVISKRLAISFFDISHESNKDKLAHFNKYTDEGFFKIPNTCNIYVDVDQEYFRNSQLPKVYGNYVSRTNEKSFCDVLHKFLKNFQMINHYNTLKSSTTDLYQIENLIKKMDAIVADKDFPYLWNIMSFLNTSVKTIHDKSFNLLLSFFSLMEVILINDERHTPKNEYKNKLPFFMEDYLVMLSLYKKDKHEFITQLVQLRHKVIHGEIVEAQKILDYMIQEEECITEDAENSTFFLKLTRLNLFLSNALGYLFFYWLEYYEEMKEIKQTKEISEIDLRKLLNK
ncbi:hypothetical protein [Bacillus thuringiensis]|uniref:hypothetical protein n=1 Tax=Bacillus thuringiensis TaxID=1428 RepID=UPI002AB4A1AF|nr:hypothetical protein [Bacillus thuringiensis]MDY8161889.1 hypothetical protein [Bacillus thuringiensis]